MDFVFRATISSGVIIVGLGGGPEWVLRKMPSVRPATRPRRSMKPATSIRSPGLNSSTDRVAARTPPAPSCRCTACPGMVWITTPCVRMRWPRNGSGRNRASDEIATGGQSNGGCGGGDTIVNHSGRPTITRGWRNSPRVLKIESGTPVSLTSASTSCCGSSGIADLVTIATNGWPAVSRFSRQSESASSTPCTTPVISMSRLSSAPLKNRSGSVWRAGGSGWDPSTRTSRGSTGGEKPPGSIVPSISISSPTWTASGMTSPAHTPRSRAKPKLT